MEGITTTESAVALSSSSSSSSSNSSSYPAAPVLLLRLDADEGEDVASSGFSSSSMMQLGKIQHACGGWEESKSHQNIISFMDGDDDGAMGVDGVDEV